MSIIFTLGVEVVTLPNPLQPYVGNIPVKNITTLLAANGTGYYYQTGTTRYRYSFVFDFSDSTLASDLRDFFDTVAVGRLNSFTLTDPESVTSTVRSDMDELVILELKSGELYSVAVELVSQ